MTPVNILLLVLLAVPAVHLSGLSDEILEDIAAQKDGVDSIINYVLRGAGYHGMYNQLAEFSDDYGPRLSGSQDLEVAINYTLTQLRNEGFSNVHSEDVLVPHWVRGSASCTMLSPRLRRLYVLALGRSEPTPPEGISADVIVVENFEELEDKAAEVPGKIVVYNQPWTNYGESVNYRSNGAAEAAKKGAVAALVRSVTDFSVYSPHVGNQYYQDEVPRIPVASITVEDAEMMKRLQDRGKQITLNLTMTCENFEDITSRNVIADWPGEKYPDEFVVIGGHIDTWDVGFGPMDDGGGMVMSWQVLKILKALGLTPKRTVRVIFWTGEEFGVYGGEKYFEDHKADNASISLIMESDSGTFRPRGIGFEGAGLARAIMEEIALLLAEVNATMVGPTVDEADIAQWVEIGVPGGSLVSEDQDYFIYHHSNGDSMTMEDPDVLDLCTAVWTSIVYAVANLEDKLPRSGEHPGPGSGSPGVNPGCGMIALVTLFGVVCRTLSLKS